jgi:hypothetical protein
MIAAVMGTIALCAGSHAVVSPSVKQRYLAKPSVKSLRADAREARSSDSSATYAVPQVPIHKTTTILRKEDTQ